MEFQVFIIIVCFLVDKVVKGKALEHSFYFEIQIPSRIHVTKKYEINRWRTPMELGIDRGENPTVPIRVHFFLLIRSTPKYSVS